MPVKTRGLGLLSSRAGHEVPLLDEPPIGHLQALVLKKLYELDSDAYGYKVLEQLSVDTGVWIDVSQVYACIRKLADKDPALIKQTETRRSPDGGPPLKIYKLTAAGRAALKATAAHHRAVADFLDK
jgi:DNA-binding PadR family transcriptional regulator